MADLQAAPPTDVVRDQDKIMLVLSYFGILALIPYLTVKDSDYVKWHAKQGLTLVGVVVVGEIALGIVIGILSAIVHALSFLGCFFPLIGLGILVVSIMGMVKAFGGQRWRIPVIADLADRW